MTSKTMLSYPGGKSRAVSIITSYFPRDIDILCSPFVGGASIELYMASQGCKVFAYDVFQPLIDFWTTVIEKPVELANGIKHFLNISKEDFYSLQKKTFISSLESAVAFFVLNKSSFSGSTYSGGYSKHNSVKRLTEAAINRVQSFYNPNIEIRYCDYEKSLEKHSADFKYLDPPYLISKSLYGKNGSTHKYFDHKKLSDILKSQNDWICSYNDCPIIRDLYKDFEIIPIHWKYGMSNINSASNEILIINRR